MITLLNPKAIVFYMAFFPLFVDPARHQGLATFAFMADVSLHHCNQKLSVVAPPLMSSCTSPEFEPTPIPGRSQRCQTLVSRLRQQPLIQFPSELR